jgi:hypothetical protein
MKSEHDLNISLKGNSNSLKNSAGYNEHTTDSEIEPDYKSTQLSSDTPSRTLESQPLTGGLAGIRSYNSRLDIQDEITNSYKSVEHTKELNTETKGISNFQHKLLRSIVDEVAHEHYARIHMELQNMHLDIIQQFQLQKVLKFNPERIARNDRDFNTEFRTSAACKRIEGRKCQTQRVFLTNFSELFCTSWYFIP